MNDDHALTVTTLPGVETISVDGEVFHHHYTSAYFVPAGVSQVNVSAGSVSLNVGTSQKANFNFLTDSGEVVILGNYEGTISGFRSGNIIDIEAAGAVSSYDYNSQTYILTLHAAVQDIAIRITPPFAGAYSTNSFTVHALDPLGFDTVIMTDVIPCFARGTLILTDRGELPVEALQVGDLVATAAQGASPEAPAFRPVRFVGTRTVKLAGAGQSDWNRPIRVRAGALGNGLPHRDLLVSGDHSLFLEGHLVPAKFLVNGRSITTETAMAEVTYFHIELDSHDLLFSEGALTESWLDNGNRSRFSNAPVVALRPADDMPRAWNEGACHPHLIEGPALAALHARLAMLHSQPVIDECGNSLTCSRHSRRSAK